MFALFEGIQRQLGYSLLPLSESQISTVQFEKNPCGNICEKKHVRKILEMTEEIEIDCNSAQIGTICAEKACFPIISLAGR
jgi:hypothetical protein